MKSRRSRVLKWFGLGLILFLSAILYMYFQLQPEEHFKEVAPLAVPKHSLVEKQPPVKGQLSKEKKEPSGNQQTEPFNVLLLGLDGDRTENTRTDVIMVANVHPEKKEINLLSIPRDTRVELDGIGLTKINHAHILAQTGKKSNGTKASIQAVSNFLGIPIHYYVKTDFQGFVSFIDDIGGIEITLPQPVQLDEALLKEGHQTLGGELALDFVRERYNLPNGDFGRQESQMMVLASAAQKLLRPENIPRLPSLYTKLKQDIADTNFAESDIVSLGLLFKGMSSDQVHYFQLPGHSATGYDPLVKRQLYYWIPDEEEVNKLLAENFK